MKTRIMTMIVLVLPFISRVYGQYPIPSYNVQIKGNAYFSENASIGHANEDSKGKRNVTVRVITCGLSGRNAASIWFCSLDGRDVIGPITATGDTTIQGCIDNRLWGVIVITEEYLIADVWIGEEISMRMDNAIIKNHFDDINLTSIELLSLIKSTAL